MKWRRGIWRKISAHSYMKVALDSYLQDTSWYKIETAVTDCDWQMQDDRQACVERHHLSLFTVYTLTHSPCSFFFTAAFRYSHLCVHLHGTPCLFWELSKTNCGRVWNRHVLINTSRCLPSSCCCQLSKRSSLLTKGLTSNLVLTDPTTCYSSMQ